MLKKEFENVLGRIYLDSIGHKGQPPTIYPDKSRWSQHSNFQRPGLTDGHKKYFAFLLLSAKLVIKGKTTK